METFCNATLMMSPKWRHDC